jgi:hypothetical protein
VLHWGVSGLRYQGHDFPPPFLSDFQSSPLVILGNIAILPLPLEDLGILEKPRASLAGTRDSTAAGIVCPFSVLPCIRPGTSVWLIHALGQRNGSKV